MAEFDSPSPHHESKTKSICFVQVAFHHKTHAPVSIAALVLDFCICVHFVIL